jgi:hypothetical protein
VDLAPREPDNGDMTGAAFRATMSALLATAAGHDCASVHSLTILTADSLRTVTAESYYLSGVDAVGFDVYAIGNEARALDYAVAKGKPLIFGEVGNVTGGATNSDAAALTYATAFWAALTPNVLAALWWSGSTDTLVGKPMLTAFLASQP